jgi:gamma-glutamylcyclotransferase (GGCT)/AIG2-like uncharacterized protein YtfP
MPDLDLIFVYGTLRRDARCVMANWLASQGEYIGDGTIPGRLYDVGEYPALRPARHSTERVVGDLYRLLRPTYALTRLDRYEGIGSGQSRPYLYSREPVQVTLASGECVTAWTYLYTGATAKLRRIAHGDYLVDGGPGQYRPVKVRRGSK